MTNLHPDLRGRPQPLDVPQRVLAIGAHPDDVEFGAGGTLARWTAAGAELVIAVVTDGSKGTWDPNAAAAYVAKARAEEQERAAAALGATTVEWLGHVDGEVEESMELRAQMSLLIRRHRPDVLLTHDPWRRYQLHPDHRATGFAVVDGVVAARDPLFFTEQLETLEPHRPDALLLWFPDEADHWEDVDLEAKMTALWAHSSQRVTTMGGDDADALTRFRARIEERAADVGAAVGMPAAEAFRRLTP